MNFLFFFSLISSFFFLTNGEENELFAQWKIENPTTTFKSESSEFSLSYNLHENMNEDNVKVKIFTADCQNPKGGGKGIEVSDGITLESVGASNGKGIFEFALDIPSLVRNDDVFDNTNTDKPIIKLCARYMLWTLDGLNEVNFVESILILHFDLKDAEFSYSRFVSQEFDSSGNAMS